MTVLTRPLLLILNTCPESGRWSQGLQKSVKRGDQIVRYNGERVYQVFELIQLQMQSADGGMAQVDILRDGVPMQIVVPQRPLGIMVGRDRRR